MNRTNNYCNRTKPDYEQWFRSGGTYFYIIMTFNRQKIFCNAHTLRLFLLTCVICCFKMYVR